MAKECGLCVDGHVTEPESTQRADGPTLDTFVVGEDGFHAVVNRDDVGVFHEDLFCLVEGSVAVCAGGSQSGGNQLIVFRVGVTVTGVAVAAEISRKVWGSA